MDHPTDVSRSLRLTVFPVVQKTTSLLLSCAGNLLLLLLAAPIQATQGHVLAQGVLYQAATYMNHPQYGTHTSYYGHRPEQVVDINIGAGSYDDEGIPLFAPEDGTVTIIHYNINRWGYSLEWWNKDGTERFFLAHLKRITVIGPVRVGQQIGEIGGTGGWKPHLHIESSKGWLELSGKVVQPPVNPYGNGMFLVSNGPALANIGSLVDRSFPKKANVWRTKPFSGSAEFLELGGSGGTSFLQSSGD